MSTTSVTDKIQIQSIGTVLQTDEQGYIVSQSSVEKIAQPWKSAADEVVELCQNILGDSLHSVYVRGSASMGKAIAGISDLDMVIVVYRSMTSKESQELRSSRKILKEKYPFCTDIEINHHIYNDLVTGTDRGCALLQVYAACVWGSDITRQLPRIKPGKQAIMHAGGFKRRIDERLAQVASGEIKFNQARCSWIMKRLLRVGGELIMEREQVFVRDLYPCYKLFSKYYPEKEFQMQLVLEYALNPVEDLHEVEQLIDDMRNFLNQEVAKVYK